MITTVEMLSEWFDKGVEKGATHMIVVCDTFSYEDGPNYVFLGQDVRKEAAMRNDKDKMLKVMEVYDLSLSKQMQLDEARAFHY